MYISIGQAALMVGVAIVTLRRWDKEGTFAPCYLTSGGHRRYSVARLEKELLGKKTSTAQRKTILYARVSSHDQKLDLERQKQRLIRHCADNQIGYELISDLGSGINYHKKGLVKLIHKIICGAVEGKAA
ncbi:MAG: hypothetical protein RLZ12_5 [Bacillota bacterium]